ncbi:hypothetical protein FHL15_002150 [Xylaria flabelliformis]|uniref:Rhodopsin domain-containing protein n=1 Tax=Xylaria flabelliformis TaxID=2512241 RepID=A0A553I9G2_9PEZI|nr:hypothetical protein FHL15_002150 [Xylaria flabelliformis]
MSFTLPGGQITAAGFLAAGITVFGVTGLFVIIRLVNSFGYSKQLFADDYLAVFAWALQAVNFGLYIQLVTEAIIGGFAIYFSKVPVLVLFVRLFGIRKWLRITIWTILGVFFALFLSTLLYVSVECSAGKVRDVPSLFNCTGSSATNGLVQGIASLILDVIIFIIPLPIVLNLHMSTSKKIGLCVVFTAGIFAIAASSVALYFKIATALGNPNSSSGTDSIILSFVEASIAIIVGCVPAIRSFWTNQLTTLTIYSKIRSLFSTQVSTGSQSAQSSFNKQSGESADHIVPASYIELHETGSMNDPNDYAHRPFQR